MAGPEIEVVQAFNKAINAADLDRLSALMSLDHRFVDSAGGTVQGRADCVAAWQSFFESFPDYRNVFDSTEVVATGEVVISGRSQCSFEPLDGPALWYARVKGDLVVEWRVEDPPERS